MGSVVHSHNGIYDKYLRWSCCMMFDCSQTQSVQFLYHNHRPIPNFQFPMNSSHLFVERALLKKVFTQKLQ